MVAVVLAAALEAVVLMCPQEARIGTPVSVPVVVDVAEPLGAYSVSLLYDTRDVTVTGVTGGTTSEFATTPVQNLLPGEARFAAYQAVRLDGPVGAVDVARVQVVPKRKGATLTLVVHSVWDTDVNPLSLQGASCTLGAAFKR